VVAVAAMPTGCICLRVFLIDPPSKRNGTFFKEQIIMNVLPRDVLVIYPHLVAVTTTTTTTTIIIIIIIIIKAATS
jgi:hypothetical protein